MITQHHCKTVLSLTYSLNHHFKMVLSNIILFIIYFLASVEYQSNIFCVGNIFVLQMFATYLLRIFTDICRYLQDIYIFVKMSYAHHLMQVLQRRQLWRRSSIASPGVKKLEYCHNVIL